jgi:uncharacterized protein
MEYRRLGRTELQVSAISLGTEYLMEPSQEDVVRIIHEALDRGINYFDLFWPQPWFRDKMGTAFAGRRQEALLAAHLGAVMFDNQSGVSRDPALAERFFHEFLTRYNTDYVDLLYLHNCDSQEDYDQLMRMDGLLGLALQLKAQGKARFLAFSGHTVSTALQAVQSGHFDAIMFPINLVGNAVPGKREFLQTCAIHDVGVVAMKPYAGGKLLQAEQVMAMENWQVGGPDAMELHRAATITPVQCLAYVLSQIGISTVVPGCKNLDELAQALAYWDADEQGRDFTVPLAGFQQAVRGDCVYCNHCLPCPAEIDIGATIRLIDQARIAAGDAMRMPELRTAYAALEHNADDCLQCGDCEKRCPFGVQVIERMEQGVELFTG